MRKGLIVFSKAIIIVFILTIINCFLLVMSFYLPTGKMRQHMADSSMLIDYEELYHEWAFGYTTTRMDYLSEFTEYGMAINEDSEGSAFEQAMFMRFIDTEGLERDESVGKYATEPDAYFELSEYPRYWHGIVLVMKMLLYFFTVQDIRIINMALELTLITAVIFSMSRKGFETRIPQFITALIFINPVTMMLSVIFSSEFVIMLITILGIIEFGDKLDSKSGAWYIYFASVGAITCFYSELSSPVIALGIPLVFLIWHNNQNHVTRTALFNSFFWIMGYSITWGMKWVICTLFTDYNLIAEAIGQATKYEDESVLGATLTERISRNIWPFMTATYKFIFIIAVLVVVVMAVLNFRKNSYLEKKVETVSKDLLIFTDKIVGYLIVFVIPFGMIIALGNGYSYVHFYMSHRQLAISVLACLCIIDVLTTFFCGAMGKRIKK